LPVFLSRVSRHSAIYVRKDRIKTAGDFVGKRVGVPEWAQTAAVYGRGVMQHELGIDLTKIKWVQAGLGEAGRAEKVTLNLPKGLELTPIADRSLTDMLDKGDIDAIVAATPPNCMRTNKNVGRFYDNWLEAEMEYARTKKILPIMHTLVVKKTVLDKAPWAAGNIFNAFDRARANAVKRAAYEGATVIPVPWLAEAARRAKEAMGGDMWPYGLEANRPTLEAFLQFAYEQGVCARKLTPEEIFPPQTHHAVRV
jgi:4,5-dihydroxyphthalate decarboxylase